MRYIVKLLTVLLVLVIGISACSQKTDEYTPRKTTEQNSTQPSSDVKTTYAHISIDDVSGILKDLCDKKPDSVWSQKELGLLKTLHDRYGIVVTLELFRQDTNTGWDISQMTDNYKDELIGASTWLRFGFHSGSGASKYGVDNGPEEALKDYVAVVDSVVRFASAESIDNIPRIHYFAASKECIESWENAENGIVGLLSADDERLPYAMNKDQSYELTKKDMISIDGLSYYRTDMRFENCDDPVSELRNKASNPDTQDQMTTVIAFTHEVMLTDRKIIKRLTNTCEWLYDNGYTFAFPEDLPKMK